MTEGNGDVRELPRGWILVQHKEIAEINPKLPFNDLSDDLLVSFLPMAAVEEKSGRFSLSEIREYEKVKKGYTQFVNGDLILAKITPCMENGKVAVVENLQNGIGFGSTEFHVSRLTSLTSRKYLFYYFVQERFRRDARQSMTGSAGQLRVSKSYFEEIKIPLAPLLEQDRIVERIEELFSDVDKGVESLKTAQKQLKVYRQAVLKWAFEGKLTEAWRAQHSSALKTGEALLAQIKAERENRYRQKLAEWETAVKEWEAIGKIGKKLNKPQRRKELSIITSSELAELPKLPDDWCWVKLGEITEVSGGLTKNSKRNELNLKLPYLRVANVYANRFYLDEVFDIGLEKEEVERVLLQQNDLLVVEGNGSIEQIGRVAIWGGKINPCVHQNHLIKARPSKSLNVKCTLYFLLSYQGREFIKREAGSTSGLHTLSLSKVENLKIPLSSEEEQEQIVEEIESRLSICDQLEATIIENLQKAEALRQSILKQAFEGKLVPQDPNDEPAETLLNRIQAERQVNGNTGKKSKPAHQQLTLQEL